MRVWTKGLKLSTQAADGRAMCFCGAAIGLNDRTRRLHRHMESEAEIRRASPLR
jgi:hypothetical protein